MKRARNVLITIVTIYVLIAAVLYTLQRQMLYFPTQSNPTPQNVGLSGVEVVSLSVPDGETVLLWYSPATPGQPTVLFFQGNGGEIADRANRFAAYQAAGFGVAFLSFRGYGGSTGTPTERGFMIDAVAAYDWLLSQDVSASEIALVGESLGTGVAVQLAAQREVGALLLGAPFTAAVDIAARRYPWLPVRMLMKDQFRSRDRIGNVTAPILIQHGTADRVVPFVLGQRLVEAAGDRATFIPVQDAGHQMLYGSDILDREIAFIKSVLAT